MSIHSSALADAELANAIEEVVHRACTCAPTYAADLVQHAGVYHLSPLALGDSGLYFKRPLTKKSWDQGACCNISLHTGVALFDGEKWFAKYSNALQAL